jgi:DNA-binding response OmpR family regulator
MKRILILEDDLLFGETIEDFLDEEGFEVSLVKDPSSAFELCFENDYDLYLFDINLPFQSGLDTFRELRESGDPTPVIFLTSREDRESVLEGFDIGADDYLKKPVDLDELKARINAVLRRRGILVEGIRVGKYRLDPQRKDLFDGDRAMKVGRKIYDMLELLIENGGRVVTIDMIKERLWTDSKKASDGAIRVYITRLKKMFPDSIENIRGVGYRFDPGNVRHR